MKDAYTNTRGGGDSRQAQLTVWDVLNLSIAEGSKAGDFKVGQRFLVSGVFLEKEGISPHNLCQVTNLMPKQLSAWMERGPGSEVYLATTKNTKWKRMP